MNEYTKRLAEKALRRHRIKHGRDPNTRDLMNGIEVLDTMHKAELIATWTLKTLANVSSDRLLYLENRIITLSSQIGRTIPFTGNVKYLARDLAVLRMHNQIHSNMWTVEYTNGVLADWLERHRHEQMRLF